MLYHLFEQKSKQPFGWELKLGGAKLPSQLYPSQDALTAAGMLAAIIRTDDGQELPLQLTEDAMHDMVFIPTSAWPGRWDEYCATCHLAIDAGDAARLLPKGGDWTHGDPEGCEAARQKADGRRWITTVPEETGAEGFGTHTVELLPFVTSRGSRYRSVWMASQHEDWQKMRYASCGGLCVLDNEKERADIEDLAAHGLAVRITEESEVAAS